MPHNKSTTKRLRQSHAARAYNRAVRSRARALVKSARQAEGADAQSALVSAYAGLDRAAKHGVIPRRRAARLKSRLAKRARALAG